MDQCTMNECIGLRELRIRVSKVIGPKGCRNAVNRASSKNRDRAAIIKQPRQDEPANDPTCPRQKNMHQDACFAAHSRGPGRPAISSGMPTPVAKACQRSIKGRNLVVFSCPSCQGFSYW